MFKDLGINKTAFIRVEFNRYFDQLKALGETNVESFNKTLWDENDNAGL